MLIAAFAILIFLGLMHRSSQFVTTKRRENQQQQQRETFRSQEPPHFLRRLGLSPPYCPFRDQF
jgi:hypothetical protein